MAENPKPPISVKQVVYRLQLSLLAGVSSPDHLYAAGSVLSRADYSDVVTERSIASLCGYPLCPNPLPSDDHHHHGHGRRRRKGRYRISLSEHKVYDLRETYQFCSPACVVDSKAFEGSLNDERCAVLDSGRMAHILGMFGESELGFVEDGNLGIPRLRIEEKSVEKGVPSEERVGASNAIEGYVPRRERKSSKRGSKAKNTLLINDMDFASVVVTEDEYTVSKTPSSLSKTSSDSKFKNLAETGSENQFTILESSCTPVKRNSKPVSTQWKGESSKVRTIYELGVEENAMTAQGSSNLRSADKDSIDEVTEKLTGVSLRSSLKTSQKKKLTRSVTWADEKSDGTGRGKLCEVRSIEDLNGKALRKMKAEQLVTRANEKGDGSKSKNVCEVRDTGGMKEASDTLRNNDTGDSNHALRLASAEACARALNGASEAVAAEESEVSDALSEAGIIVLPLLDHVGKEEPMKEDDESKPEQAPIKWPEKPEVQRSELLNPDDSWFDSPPVGFNLTLSTFAKMWNALFTWTTSSTLAYIYGRDESSHEEYLSVNGREYLQKVVLGDGRSSEIKHTLAGSLSRALPGLVAELRLPTPISSLEQGMGCLLDTMSFVDALPSFRMKQWQVIVLLFIDALSVYRLPALAPHMVNRTMLFHKVLDGTQISGEEYEVMKDLMIPLGRTPHISAQSGA